MQNLSIFVEAKFQNIHKRLDVEDVRVSKLEETLFSGNMLVTDGIMAKEIEALKTEIEALKIKHVEPDVLERTSLVGGLSSLQNFENLKTWITNNLWKTYGPTPGEIYCKGDFKGIAFIKFATKGERDAAVKIFREAGCQEGGYTVRLKPNLPTNDRLRHSFIFGVKYISKRGRWAKPKGGTDGKAGLVWFGEEMSVTANIEENKNVLSYGMGWEQYFKQKEHPDFIEFENQVKNTRDASDSRMK